MRAKSFNKRLNLNKQTIATLKNNQMQKLKGGACTCQASGCATWIWQDCIVSNTHWLTICLDCETDTFGTCC